MARYTEGVCRKCRREGMKLFLKGQRCYSPKCAIEKRNFVPGQHGRNKKGKLSNYGVQLREKQKLRNIYGIMERQFENYYYKASSQKGVTGENLIKILERRLDNVVFRMGFALSRAQARQLVCHRHFKVNGRTVNIPSYLLKPGDEIVIAEKSREIPFIKQAMEVSSQRNAVNWIDVHHSEFRGKVVTEPTRESVDVPIDESLIIEYYSR